MTKEKKYEIDETDAFTALGRKNAKDLLIRSDLLEKVEDLIEKSGISQREVGKKLGITQSKVSALVNGRVSEFSMDSLLNYLAILGCVVEIHVQVPRSRIGIFRDEGQLAVC